METLDSTSESIQRQAAAARTRGCTRESPKRTTSPTPMAAPDASAAPTSDPSEKSTRSCPAPPPPRPARARAQARPHTV